MAGAEAAKDCGICSQGLSEISAISPPERQRQSFKTTWMLSSSDFDQICGRKLILALLLLSGENLRQTNMALLSCLPFSLTVLAHNCHANKLIWCAAQEYNDLNVSATNSFFDRQKREK